MYFEPSPTPNRIGEGFGAAQQHIPAPGADGQALAQAADGSSPSPIGMIQGGLRWQTKACAEAVNRFAGILAPIATQLEIQQPNLQHLQGHQAIFLSPPDTVTAEQGVQTIAPVTAHIGDCSPEGAGLPPAADRLGIAEGQQDGYGRAHDRQPSHIDDVDPLDHPLRFKGKGDAAQEGDKQ